MKIVLDTNCLVNVIMPGSFNNDVWQAFRANKYVLCATYIVSNDHHFKELQNYDFPKVDVRTLPEFLKIVRKL